MSGDDAGLPVKSDVQRLNAWIQTAATIAVVIGLVLVII